MKLFKSFKLFGKRSSKLNLKAIDKEIGKYQEWKKVSVKTSQGDMFFHVQPYMSSFEIDQIIENYGKFLEKYAKEIEDIGGSDNSRALKIIYGILYSFLVRYKSDILSEEDKTIVKEYTGEQMMLFSMNLITLNIFNEIMKSYDEGSMDILFSKFNTIIKTGVSLKDNRDFVRNLDKAYKENIKINKKV